MIIPDKKKAATVIVSMMHGQDLKTPDDEGDSEHEECVALGQDLLDAVAAKDAMGAYNAMKAIFLKVDLEPHEEYGEEEEEEEYE